MSITVSVAPTSEPFEANTLLHDLDINNDQEVTSINSMIKMLRQYLERKYNIRFITQTLVEALDDFTSGSGIRLTGYPVNSVTSVEYYDDDNVNQVISSSNYYLDNNGLITRIKWIEEFATPTVYFRPDAIRITYVCGYTLANIPEPIRQQFIWTIGKMYYDKENMGKALGGMDFIFPYLRILL